MGWTVDDIDLDTLAFNISNRAASWKTPAKRGDNLVIPGRHGSKWLPNKPFEEGHVTLNMWAVGANEDGSAPTEGGAARKVRENIDKLTAIFGQSSKLLDVVRISSNVFGIENTVSDPSFESAAVVSPWSTYQNCIINPAMRKTTSTVDEISNLMPNPVPVTLQATPWQNYSENLVLDPLSKRDRSLPEAMVAVNSYGGGSFEENITPSTGEWDPAPNTTADVYNYSAFDTVANPTGGDWFLGINTTSTLATNASLGERPHMPTRPNTRPYFTFRVRRRDTSGAGTRTIQCRIVVTNSSGTQLSAGTWQGFTIPAFTGDSASWNTCNYDSTGMTNTADGYNRIEFRTGESWPSGDRIYLDCMTFVNAGEAAMTGGYWSSFHSNSEFGAGPYFDAGLGWANYDYVTPANAPWTRTRVNTYRDDRWQVDAATGSTSAYYAYAYTPNATDASGTCVNFVAFGSTTGGTQNFYLPLGTPTAGETYTYNFNYRAQTGTHEVRLQKKGTGDSNYVDVGSSFSVNGGGTPSLTGSQMTGTAQQAYPQTSYTAQVGDLMRVRVTVPVRKDGNPTLQINNLHVTNNPGVSVTGDTVDTVNSVYSWSGTTYDSKTILQRRRLKRFSSKHGYIALSDSERAEVVCPGSGVATSLTTDNFAITNGTRGFYARANVTGGFTAHATANSYAAPTAFASLVFLDASSTTLTTISGASVVLNTTQNTADYQVVSVTVPPSLVPSTATQVRLVVSLANPLAGQLLNGRLFGIFTYGAALSSIGLPDYFDGSTSGASWVSTANDSTSRVQITGSEAASWVRDNGINLGTWIPGQNQKSAKSPDSLVSFRNPIGTTMISQEYQFGVEAYAETYDSSGARVNVPVDVYLEFRSGASTVVGSPIFIGTLGSQNVDLKQGLQTTATPSGSFDHVGVVFKARTAVSATAAAIFRAYLYPSNSATFASPVPRMDRNRVNNPYFIYNLELWATTGSPNVAGGICSLPNTATIQSTPLLNPPTYVRTVTTDYTTAGASKTSPTFDVQNGDLVVIQGATADSTFTLGTPTWTGTGTVSAVSGATISAASFDNAYTWSIAVGGTATGRTVTIANSSSSTAWGFSVSVWRNHNGIGASAEITGSGAPALGITTTIPNSGLNIFVTDWTGANSGNPRTWRSVNNAPIFETNFGDSANSTFFSGVVTDAGSAGSKTVGLTAPTNPQFTAVAVEIRPAAPSAISGVAVRPPVRVSYVNTPFTNGASKTSPAFNVEQGDLVVISAVNESSSLTLPTPTWTGSGSVSLQEDLATGTARGRIWTISVSAAATLRTVSLAGYGSTTSPWAMDVTVWRAHGGVGVQNQATGTTGAPAITQTVAASSAVQFMAIDTTGTSTAAPTWLSVNGSAMVQTRHSSPVSGVTASAYSSYSADAGTTGSKTFGMSAPSSGLNWGAVSIEILGAPQATFVTRAMNGSGNGKLTPSVIWTKTDYSTVTVTLPTIDSTTLNVPMQHTVAIPSSAAVGTVKYTSSVSSGSDPQVSFTYLGSALAGFPNYSDLDPYPFYYGDGTMGGYFGTAGRWGGTADDSFSYFQPDLSPSWVNTASATGVSVHELASPGISQGTWNGQVGGIFAASKGASKTVRSVGAPTFGRSFVSGEISIGTKPFASVVARLYQASSSTGSGVLLWTSPVVPSNSAAVHSWRDLQVTDSYVYLEMTYTESENVSGYRVFLDNFMVIPTDFELASEYPGYFDGNVSGVWTGNSDNSISTYTGGGRRAWCEVTEAIDMTSQAGGTRAEFSVDMVIPGAFWEDLTASSMTFSLQSLVNYEQTLFALASATAPIDDALITLTVTGGTVTNLTLTDVASGAELKITGTLPTTVVIDNSNFKVTDQTGASIISSVTRKNSNQLFPLTPMSSTEAPRIRVNASGSGTLVMDVVAKRRYLIA